MIQSWRIDTLEPVLCFLHLGLPPAASDHGEESGQRDALLTEYIGGAGKGELGSLQQLPFSDNLSLLRLQYWEH